MTLLFSNATVLPMTDPCDASRTLTGWVGVVGNRGGAGHRLGGPMLRRSVRHIPACARSTAAGGWSCRGSSTPHCHAGMTLQRSYADDIPLMSWAQRLYLALRIATDARRRGAGHDARDRRDAAGRRDVVRGHVLFPGSLRGGGRTAGDPCRAGLQLFRYEHRRGFPAGGVGCRAGCRR